MHEEVKAQYDSLYAARDNVYNDGLPQRAAQLIPKYVATGAVLDVGAGEGQNALWLSREGFTVTALDLSEVGLKKLASKANEEALQIDTVIGDIENYEYNKKFDVVLFSFTLHHLNTEPVLEVLKKAKAYTSAKGIHVIATFSDEGGLYERAKKSGRFYPSEEILRELYKDWDILKLSKYERESIAKDKKGVPLKNKAILFVARHS